MEKKIIKLTEQELHDIENDFNVNSIDISKIDIELLKQAYVDLRLVPSITVYGDILSDKLGNNIVVDPKK